MPTTEISELTMSAATLYVAPIGTTLPADTVIAGGAWPVGWVSIGLTSAPLKTGYSFDTKSPEIQQAMGSVKRKKIKEEIVIETMMAQLNFATIAKIWGGTVTVTPAGAGQPGKEEYKVGGASQIPVLMWGFEGEQEDDAGLVFPIRGFIFRGSGSEGGDLEWNREDYTGIPLKVTADEDLTKPKGQRLLSWVRITGAATS